MSMIVPKVSKRKTCNNKDVLSSSQRISCIWGLIWIFHFWGWKISWRNGHDWNFWGSNFLTWQDSLTIFVKDTGNYVGLPKDSFTPGLLAWVNFFQLLLWWKFLKLIVISFADLQKISLFPKFEGCGSKIEPATPILI